MNRFLKNEIIESIRIKQCRHCEKKWYEEEENCNFICCNNCYCITAWSEYSYDYDREKHGYTSMIDVDSFVDYFIINELSSNADAGNYSTYIYKGTDNLYRMCVWDFNNACNNYFED